MEAQSASRIQTTEDQLNKKHASEIEGVRKDLAQAHEELTEQKYTNNNLIKSHKAEVAQVKMSLNEEHMSEIIAIEDQIDKDAERVANDMQTKHE